MVWKECAMAKKQDLIGYCGLHCGDCPGYTQTVANLAGDLREQLRRDRFSEMADMMAKVPVFKEFKHYDNCYNLLGTMMKLRCKKTCRGNGGPPKCKIRSCSRKKGLEGCWQCDDFSTCEKLKILEPGHGVAHLKNLRKIKRQGPAAFLKGKRYWHAAR
jgi:hypothetical protein